MRDIMETIVTWSIMSGALGITHDLALLVWGIV